jgi:uncharacterized protein (DUF433 family)
MLVFSPRSKLSCEFKHRLVQTSMQNLPSPLITASPDRLGGTAVFSGTRVPVQSLIDYLTAGHPLDDFIKQFPSVSREHAVAVLELAKNALLTPVE